MGKSFLLLWLEAPLQSWGHDSKFGRRDTLDFPTKSGVLGLLCSARGAGGPEREWLAQWSAFDMRVLAFRPEKQARLPLLRDFHMVGSGYDLDDLWQNLLIPKTSEGKRAVGGGSKLTYRYYIQDMAFAVIFEANSDPVNDAVTALKNPHWDLFLGRKTCVPTELIFRGVFDSFDECERSALNLAQEKNRKLEFSVVEGVNEGEVVTLNDVPVQFGVDKKYRDRRVTVKRHIFE